jgi:hypothetical protein
MASSSGGFNDLAADLADRFVRPVRNRGLAMFAPASGLSVPPVFLVDVQVATEALLRQCDFLRENKLEFPCIEPRSDGDKTPIPISLGLENLIQPSLLRFSVSALRAGKIFQDVIWEKSGTLVQVKIDEAIGFFQTQLTSFLGARLLGTPSNVPPPLASNAPSGVWFRVDTASSGLRVYYAPVYWHSNQHVLNYPTTPVSGFINAGRYHFGAAPPGQMAQFDFSASYKLPPDSNAYLAM